MYTIQETADIFEVHYQTIRKWINSGHIKALKIDQVVRIPQAEIDRLKAGENQCKETNIQNLQKK